jgi:hypothetical protein
METTSTDLNTPIAVLVPSKIRHVGDIAIRAIPTKSTAANRHGIKGRKSRSPKKTMRTCALPVVILVAALIPLHVLG